MVEPLSFGLFGKVQSADDFVRAGAVDQAFSLFDQWLVSAIERAHGVGDDWRSAFRVGSPQAFVFRRPGGSSEEALLVGALAPSSDRHGRMFPLVVATPFMADAYLASHPELLPIVLEPIWQHAGTLVDSARTATDKSYEGLVGASEAVPAPVDEAARTYEEWIARLPASELWTLLYRAPGDDSRVPEGVPLRAMRMLSEAMRPLRGVERPTTPLSAWLPLGRAGGAAVCFWLDLVKRLADWRHTVPSYFWSHDGASGKMLIHLGEPPRSTVAELWLPSQRRDEFFDLTSPRTDEDVSSVGELTSELMLATRADRTLVELLSAAGAG